MFLAWESGPKWTEVSLLDQGPLIRTTAALLSFQTQAHNPFDIPTTYFKIGHSYCFLFPKYTH